MRLLASPRSRRTWVRLTALAAAMMIVFAPAAAVAAPSVADLEKLINEAWNKLEPIIEQYNMVHAQLTANQAKAAVLSKKLAPLQLQIEVSRAQLGDVAASMYMGGNLAQVNALVSDSSPQILADRMTTLSVLARRQNDQIAGVVVLRDKYAADKQILDELIATQAQQDMALSAQKKTIETRIAALQKLRIQAYGAGAVGKFRLGPCPGAYAPTPGYKAAAKACSLIGKPYEWGAAGPDSYDCSGLTLVAWRAAGVTLRHYTKWQWEDNTPVSRANLQIGDLVFYFPPSLHHMGIYVGGGWIVHAPTTGDFVRMAKLDNGMPLAGFRRPN